MALQINNPQYGNIFVTAENFAELRTVSSKQIQDGYAAIIAGDLAPGDGFGGMLVWNASSTAPDNSRTVIAPQDGQPGRWIRIAVGEVGPTGPVGPVSTVPGPPGIPGSSNNTRATLAELKAAPVTDLSSIYANALWKWDASATANGTDRIASDRVSSGAWVRQSASEISNGAETVADFLNSSFRLGYDVSISSSATLDIYAFGKIHEVSAAVTVTLPNPGISQVHNAIVIRIADNCPGMVTIAANFAYGNSFYRMWAGEEVVLEYLGGIYKVRSSTRKAMAGSLSITGNIGLVAETWSNFLVQRPSADIGAYNLAGANGADQNTPAGITPYTFYFDAANSRFVAPRSGTWRICWHLSVVPNADSLLSLTMSKNGADLDLAYYQEIKMLAANGRQGYLFERCEYMAQGNYIIPRAKLTGGGGAIDSSIGSFITVHEVI